MPSLNDVDALRRRAFVVVFVGAGEFYAGDFVNGGIVGDAQEFGQHFLAQLFS